MLVFMDAIKLILNSDSYWFTKKPTTFTVTWTETSSPTSFNPVYSNDATWLSAWSTSFDDFFWYSAVKLDISWNETAEVEQRGGVLDLSPLWSLSWWDNIMIKFPVRWIKMTKSWSKITLSITDWLWREGEGYQYYAHRNEWTINNTKTPKNNLYIWAYLAYNNSSVLKSWSGVTPTASISIADFCTYAKANWTWYQIIWYYQRQLINAYYMMKYGNPNAKSVIWSGVTGGAVTWTWWTNGQINATYGTSDSTKQVKLFWLEDWWWNLYEYTWWAYNSSSTLYITNLWNYSWETTWGISSWSTLVSDGNISAVAGTNKSMFSPISKVTNTSYNTYYSAYTYYTWNNSLRFGWWYNTWAWASPFSLTAQMTGWDSRTWTRLIFL